MIAEVWTNDDLKFLYEIIEVRRHQTTLDGPAKVKRDELWLQTSEGPRGTVGKTQVRARLLSVERAAHAHGKPDAEAGELRVVRSARSSRSGAGRAPPPTATTTVMTRDEPEPAWPRRP